MTELEPSRSNAAHPLFVEVPGGVAGARVAIAGAGGIAAFAHIPAYRRIGLDIAAVYDPDASRAQAAAEKSGPGTRVYTDETSFFAALPELGVEVLDVAVPSPAHAQSLRSLFTALGARAPVLLVQKPLAQTAAESRQLVELAQRHGVTMGVNLNGRWVPTFRKARELVRAGTLGRVALATLTNRGLNRKRSGEWRAQIERLIGYEMAIHHVDLLVWMFGLPRWVFARLDNVGGFGVAGDNCAVIDLGFEDGPVANVVEDWLCRDREAWQFHPTGETLVLSGARATLTATPQSLRLCDDGGETRFETDAAWFPDAFAGPMAEMIAAVRAGRTPEIAAAAHVSVLDVLEAAYRSSAGGEVVRLPGEGA